MDPIMEMNEWPRDFHAVSTVKFGELVEIGWYNPSDPTWQWDYYTEEQYSRLCTKFVARYWDREIGILPPGEWKRSYIRKLNEIMPKYKKMYEEYEDIDIMQIKREYGKDRQIYSDFPQTLLSENEDYASTGKDDEYEKVTEGDPIERLEDMSENFRDIDVMILDELEILFSSLVSVSINLF